MVLRKAQSDEFVEVSCIEAYTQSREKIVKIYFDIVRVLNELGNFSHLFFEDHLGGAGVTLHIGEDYEQKSTRN